MSKKQPLICPECGQRGDERPGFRRRRYPEAVGVSPANDHEPDPGMVPVDSFECCTCGFGFVVPVGTIEVRRP